MAEYVPTKASHDSFSERCKQVGRPGRYVCAALLAGLDHSNIRFGDRCFMGRNHPGIVRRLVIRRVVPEPPSWTSGASANVRRCASRAMARRVCNAGSSSCLHSLGPLPRRASFSSVTTVSTTGCRRTSLANSNSTLRSGRDISSASYVAMIVGKVIAGYCGGQVRQTLGVRVRGPERRLSFFQSSFRCTRRATSLCC